jgi:hypothetical protein
VIVVLEQGEVERRKERESDDMEVVAMGSLGAGADGS